MVFFIYLWMFLSMNLLLFSERLKRFPAISKGSHEEKTRHVWSKVLFLACEKGGTGPQQIQQQARVKILEQLPLPLKGICAYKQLIPCMYTTIPPSS